MFQCQHQLAMCKIHDCSKCGYRGREDQCPFAARSGRGDTVPTFAECLAAYESGTASRARKAGIRRLVTKSVTLVGLSPDSPVSDMTYAKFEELLDRLLAPESGLRPITVADHLAAFSTVTHASREHVKYLRGIGREPFRFSIPEYRPERPKKQTVTMEQARRVIVGMERWFASGRESDRTCALLLFFELYMDMRAGDVCRLKWDCIRQTALGMMFVYVPHKTERSSGAEVSFVIDPMVYQIVRPYVGAPDEYVLPRHADRTPRHATRHGECSGMHLYARKRVNRFVSECGIGNDYRGQKRGHALRKFRATLNARAFGEQEAARRLGDSVAMARRSYVGSEYSLVAPSVA